MRYGKGGNGGEGGEGDELIIQLARPGIQVSPLNFPVSRVASRQGEAIRRKQEPGISSGAPRLPKGHS